MVMKCRRCVYLAYVSCYFTNTNAGDIPNNPTAKKSYLLITIARSNIDWCRGAISVSEMDNTQHTPNHTTSYARTTVQAPAVQSRSFKVIQRSLMTE